MRYDLLVLEGDVAQSRLSLEADDEAMACRTARSRGLVVLEVREARRSEGSAKAGVRGQRVRFDLDLFCQEILAMVRAGITVREALQTLAEKEQSESGAGILSSVLRMVEEGQPLSQAMSRHAAEFPLLLVESLRAAERTSDYAPALERFVQYRRLVQGLRSKLAAAALYPLLLLGVSLLVLLFLVMFVVPRFAAVYEDMGDRLPLASRLLLAAGQAMSSQPLLTAAGFGAVLACLVWGWRRGGATVLLALATRTVPRVARLVRASELARLYRTLALLLGGGIALADALELARGVLPGAMGGRLAQARRSIQEGRSFAESLQAHDLSSVVAERYFRVGEQTGRLADMIDRAAEFHEDEVARAADWVGRVIGPVLMLVMGVVIGTVVVLMYLPVFQLSEALS